MPILKSALKKLRSDRRRRRENLKVIQAYKQAVKQARAKLTPAGISRVFRSLDRAAKKKVIHKNKASRLKSRLSRRLSGKQ